MQHELLVFGQREASVQRSYCRLLPGLLPAHLCLLYFIIAIIILTAAAAETSLPATVV